MVNVESGALIAELLRDRFRLILSLDHDVHN